MNHLEQFILHPTPNSKLALAPSPCQASLKLMRNTCHFPNTSTTFSSFPYYSLTKASQQPPIWLWAEIRADFCTPAITHKKWCLSSTVWQIWAVQVAGPITQAQESKWICREFEQLLDVTSLAGFSISDGRPVLASLWILAGLWLLGMLHLPWLAAGSCHHPLCPCSRLWFLYQE